MFRICIPLSVTRTRAGTDRTRTGTDRTRTGTAVTPTTVTAPAAMTAMTAPATVTAVTAPATVATATPTMTAGMTGHMDTGMTGMMRHGTVTMGEQGRSCEKRKNDDVFHKYIGCFLVGRLLSPSVFKNETLINYLPKEDDFFSERKEKREKATTLKNPKAETYRLSGGGFAARCSMIWSLSIALTNLPFRRQK